MYKGEGKSLKFIYVERDWLSVGLSIHRLTAESARQSRWFGFQAAKWNAMKVYVAEQLEAATDAADKAFYESLQSAMAIEQTTTAFYKGVLEWLLARKAYLNAVNTVPTIKVKYSDVLKDVESVSKAISDFTEGTYSIDVKQATETINKKDDFAEFTREEREQVDEFLKDKNQEKLSAEI